MKYVVRALAVLGGMFLVVTATPVVSYWAQWLSGRWEEAKGETLIVLGAEDMGSGILGYSSYLRSYYALRIWRVGEVKEILILGHAVSGPMRDYLIQHGVPAGAVTAEDESGSTEENAAAARKILAGKPGRKVLLTSDYHMRRAAAAFRRQGMDVITFPFPDAIKQATEPMARWSVAYVLAQESVKLAGYWWKGWI